MKLQRFETAFGEGRTEKGTITKLGEGNKLKRPQLDSKKFDFQKISTEIISFIACNSSNLPYVEGFFVITTVNYGNYNDALQQLRR